ncbi:transporter substrate-binding domain-containing protein [Vibrio sp. T187]|uniref:substrate-binding periplasmic protein n=1 Tax=Vibrio TaxID=662 RepID=UPI0010C96521|nr:MULTISPECIES: transporter substrate-binding domain-containing protein [Vibrio]MBW3696874.1 transporter substrate-binding domain-containing protein [Vibrio sp. T187]
MLKSRVHVRRLLLSLCLCLMPTFVSAYEKLHFASIEGLPNQTVGARILREVYFRAEIEISIEDMPASRASYKADQGQLDGELVRIESYGKMHPNLVLIPIPIGYVESQIFTQPGRDLSLDKLGDYSIVIGRGIKISHDLTKGKGYPHVTELTNASQLLHFVRLGRADTAITDRASGMYLIKSENIENVVPFGQPLSKKLLYHYINIKHKALVPKLTKVMETMQKEGELDGLWERYMLELIRSK